MTVNQPTAAPTNKVVASTAVGVIVTALVAVLGVAGVDIPAEVSIAVVAAFTAGQTVVQFIAGYFTKNKGPAAP